MTVTHTVAAQQAATAGELTGRKLTRRRQHRRRRARSIARFSRDSLFAVLGVCGALALGWLVFAALTGATIITFMTGSMTPTLPQGAAAISMPVQASDLGVGDIVTVRAEDSTLPVTHRIVSIAETGTPNERELVLQGDANLTPDTQTYVVNEVPRVLIGGPGWAYVLDAVRSPIAIAAMTLVVAGLCLWAFWPTKRTDVE
jgi:signal peptidase